MRKNKEKFIAEWEKIPFVTVPDKFNLEKYLRIDKQRSQEK
jgi:hypothetical protein